MAITRVTNSGSVGRFLRDIFPCWSNRGNNGGDGTVAVTWQSLNNATATANDIISTTGAGSWAASGTTVQTISGDGYFEFTGASVASGVGQQGGGLTNDTDLGSVNSYQNIDYALMPITTGAPDIYVFELGVQKGTTYGTFTDTDVFRVTVTGTTVTYSKNGSVFYTSLTAASGGPYRGAFTGAQVGAKIDDAVMFGT